MSLLSLLLLVYVPCMRSQTTNPLKTIAGGGVSGQSSGFADGWGINATFGLLWGSKYDDKTDSLWVADKGCGRLRQVYLNGTVKSLLGCPACSCGTPLSPTYAVGTSARFKIMNDVAVTPNGEGVYVSDEGAHVISFANVSSKSLSHVVGGGTFFNLSGKVLGVGTSALFQQPRGMAFTSATSLALCDSGNNRVLLPNPALRTTSLLAGTSVVGFANGAGAVATFNSPRGLALDPIRGILFVTDTANNKIRTINLATTVVGDLVGGGLNGKAGFSLGTGRQALFNTPMGLWPMPQNNSLYVVDQNNRCLRHCTLDTANCSIED